ncbi:MAG TPA: histidinol dehydrogenase [Acidimicrobiales bacterium]|nr:histidinol dehydrogenase [Acidimicrobiales bacterium]
MLRTLDLRGRDRTAPLDLPRPDLGAEGPVEQVRQILAEVRARGDEAIREYALSFDHVELDELRVEEAALDKALASISPELRAALEEARDAIAAFHRHRAPLPERYERGGIAVTHYELPVERAGVYAPGGRAKYPSSVLMTAVPAIVAGVGEVACCAPPGPDGDPPTELLAACALAGVHEVYRIGGAQAIAAMAYGTESVRKVDVIVGPGSKWVSIAQREVRGVVGVPAAFAGPSEVVVIADQATPAEWAAIDIIVQAEHGPDGLAWLITWSEEVAAQVTEAVARLVAASPRRAETESTLAAGGYAVIVDGPEEAMAVANEIAPEHLELLVADPAPLLERVRHAGVVFVGPLAPAAVGDYLAGPSHVLPTFATARFASVLGVEDFLRRVHAVEVTPEGIARVAGHVAAIANAEGLPAHAEAALLRVDRATWSAP